MCVCARARARVPCAVQRSPAHCFAVAQPRAQPRTPTLKLLGEPLHIAALRFTLHAHRALLLSNTMPLGCRYPP